MKHLGAPLKLVVIFLDDIYPFQEFKNGKSLSWWNAINKVRHKWFDNREKANLKNSLEAMAGLFVLNVMNKPSRVELAKSNVIKSEEQPQLPISQWNQILISLENGYVHGISKLKHNFSN